MRYILFLFLLIFITKTPAQDINSKIIQASIVHTKPSEKRKLLSFKKKSAYYNPLNYAGAGLLFIYQNIFSEQIQANCMYEVSCSEYTKISIQNYGFIQGLLRGFNQLSECSPAALLEHPPVSINKNGKIINR